MVYQASPIVQACCMRMFIALTMLTGCAGPDYASAGPDSADRPPPELDEALGRADIESFERAPMAGQGSFSLPRQDAGMETGSQEVEQRADAGMETAPPSQDADPPRGPTETQEPACEKTAWYPDEDGDGFGDHDAESVSSCKPPVGHVDNAEDCYDANPRANPRATAWFEQDRGDGSFDYDCDGEESLKDARVGTCPDYSETCPPPHLQTPDDQCDYHAEFVEGSVGWYRVCTQERTNAFGLLECDAYDDADPICGERSAWKSVDNSCGPQNLLQVIVACR